MDLERVNQALSSKRWCWRFFENASCPNDLLSLLLDKLPNINPQSWQDRFVHGGIYINGQPTTTNQELKPPVQVEYFEPKFDIKDAHRYYAHFSNDYIVYEDQYLLAVFKPPKLPSLPAKEQSKYNLRSYLESYCGHPVHMPSRLDSSAQGLLLVSKSSLTHAYLQQAFEKKTVAKYYLLEVSGQPEWLRYSCQMAIGRNPAHPVLRKAVSEGGQKAQTEFKLVKCSVNQQKNKTTILEAQPITGRTHQIRVHAATLGFPIIGDNFYGGMIAPELRLLSHRITIAHPITANILDIKVPKKLCPAWAERSL